VAARLCAGGALALCACARPAGPYRDYADYVLLVRERSGSVINAAGQLAVIPKGFHEPMTDFRNDAMRRRAAEMSGRLRSGTPLRLPPMSTAERSGQSEHPT
jgi:hypothetical protein